LPAGGERHSSLNLPSSALAIEVYNTHLSAWEAGCKGITVYVGPTGPAQPPSFTEIADTPIVISGKTGLASLAGVGLGAPQLLLLPVPVTLAGATVLVGGLGQLWVSGVGRPRRPTAVWVPLQRFWVPPRRRQCSGRRRRPSRR
jgi:hypothetical protein